MSWKDKLSSRKFWICVAAFLGSIATSIAGIATSNQTVIIIGTVCGILSAAIYAFCEAWVDARAVDTREVATAIVDVLTENNEEKSE